MLGDLPLSPTIQFLPLILTQLFKLLSHFSKDVEQIKPDVLKYVCGGVCTVLHTVLLHVITCYTDSWSHW